jgi:hypothetical protein
LSNFSFGENGTEEIRETKETRGRREKGERRREND